MDGDRTLPVPADAREPALQPPGGLARLVRALRLVHPFPSLLNALVTGVLACAAVRGWPGTGTTLRLMTAMLCIQFCIGTINDWADRRLDGASKPWKPIPSGAVGARLALAAGVAFGAAGLALAAVDGVASVMLAALGLSIGLAYDLGLKRTPASALTYALALPLIPLWVWTALGRTTPAMAAVLPVGALLGLGLQLANALPDAGGDAAGGVRGTVQWLGPQRARRLAWGTLAAAGLLALLLALVLDLAALPFLPCWLAAAGLYAGAVGVYLRRRTPAALQTGWTLLAPAAGLLAAGWLASLP